MDRNELIAEMERVQDDFARMVTRASAVDLKRRSSGTRWTNRELLFHMVFGYLIVRTLMPLVRVLGRLGWSRRFAITLDAARRPFHAINFFGSWAGGHVVPPKGMINLLRRTLRAIERRLDRETEASLALTMHFPPSWDPYFRPTMTVRDVYRYGTEHYDHHREQLTLPRAAPECSAWG
ncbi:DinB family protein [Microlunatus sp. GCM10028923]|uniref:DinB family protein n=1 Tax=Microlunatus sp. GCM10028923 TaxID=3273400 RepID=UPI00361120D6